MLIVPESAFPYYSFLAALRRFIARRGKCAAIYSDNGTNFVGAARKLDEERKQLKKILLLQINSEKKALSGILFPRQDLTLEVSERRALNP